MGSSLFVPQDSTLACVKRNLKLLPLTNLKVHKLESLCIQILPQYKLDNQNLCPFDLLGLSISIFYQISKLPQMKWQMVRGPLYSGLVGP